MRLFFAAELDDVTKRHCNDMADKLSKITDGNYTQQENYHITLRFIGNCTLQQIPALSEVLHQAAADSSPFQISIEGAGCFWRRNRGILWLGISQGTKELEQLNRLLNRSLAEHEIIDEQDKFSPHITLARQVKPFDEQLLQGQIIPICYTVSAISLMESLRLDGRLVYRPILEEAL